MNIDNTTGIINRKIRDLEKLGYRVWLVHDEWGSFQGVRYHYDENFK